MKRPFLSLMLGTLQVSFGLLLAGLPPALAGQACVNSSLRSYLHEAERAQFEAELRRKEGPVRLSDSDLQNEGLVQAALSLRMHLEGLEGLERLTPSQQDLLKRLKGKPFQVSFGGSSYADFATGTAVIDRSVALRVPEKLPAYMRHELTHLLNGHNFQRGSAPPGIVFLSEVEANLQGDAHGVTEAFHMTIRNSYGGYLVDAYGPVHPSVSPYEISKILKTLCAGVGVDPWQFPTVCGK